MYQTATNIESNNSANLPNMDYLCFGLEKLERQIAFAVREGGAMIYCNYQLGALD